MKLSVIGIGYLGAVHAAVMASLGHDVIAIDTDTDRIARLQQGEVPFFESGFSATLEAGLSSGRLKFSTDLAAAAGSTVHFICVGTPQSAESDAADLSALHAVVSALGPLLGPEDVVVGKSTVPVGTAARLAAELAESGATLLWNPEFLREGHAVTDTLTPDRIVIGAPDSDVGRSAVATLTQVYATILEAGSPLVVTDFATAELAKGAANAFLATRISFMNAMAEVADAADADVVKLAEAIGHDDRIGRKYLGAGIGFGGGCLPKDIRAFSARARELGASAAAGLLEQVDSINLSQRRIVSEAASEMLGGTITGRRITVLGASFKPDSDDVRDSPALEIAHTLHTIGAQVTVTDPAAIDNARAKRPELRFVGDTLEALSNAELIVVATEWADYRTLDPSLAARQVAVPRVLDGRNCLDPVTWSAAGWTYRGIGRR